ncbi:MAG: TonB-dependent receptor, partial [Bacteroidetes bacterium]
TGLGYRVIGGQVGLFRVEEAQRGDMMALHSPPKLTLRGYLLDPHGEAIAGATVYDSLSQQGSYSNRYGFFSLSREAGPMVLLLRAANYQPHRLALVMQRDSSITLTMQPRVAGAVQIDDSMAMAGEPLTLGLIQFPVERLEEVPTLLGEPDILKALALTPGVSLGIEGSSGLLVRGGTPDQNLIRLDGARLYNVTHLLGFVSAFNSDALQEVDLYKGQFPARYGERLASVLDLRMREGNSESFRGEAGIGLVSSQLSMEGPLGERSSFLATARSSYATLAAIPIGLAYRSGSPEPAFNYWLYDLTGKVNHRFRDGGRLFLSAYHGQDWFTTREGTFNGDEFLGRYNWINQAANLRYTRPLGQRWFWEAQAHYSRYAFQLVGDDRYFAGDSLLTDRLDSRHGVQDWSGRSTLDFYPGGGHRLQGGVQGDLHRFRPRDLRVQAGDLNAPISRTDTLIPARHLAAWLEDRWRWGRLELAVGMRMSLFQAPDSTFRSWEPRLHAAYALCPRWQVSASYGRVAQYESGHSWRPLFTSECGALAAAWGPGFGRGSDALATLAPDPGRLLPADRCPSALSPRIPRYRAAPTRGLAGAHRARRTGSRLWRRVYGTGRIPALFRLAGLHLVAQPVAVSR